MISFVNVCDICPIIENLPFISLQLFQKHLFHGKIKYIIILMNVSYQMVSGFLANNFNDRVNGWRILIVSEDNKKNRVTVQINKREYTIIGAETKDHVEKIAQMVDDKMQDMKQGNKHLDATKLAVLTALNTMNEYVKLKEEYDELVTLIEEDE